RARGTKTGALRRDAPADGDRQARPLQEPARSQAIRPDGRRGVRLLQPKARKRARLAAPVSVGRVVAGRRRGGSRSRSSRLASGGGTAGGARRRAVGSSTIPWVRQPLHTDVLGICAEPADAVDVARAPLAHGAGRAAGAAAVRARLVAVLVVIIAVEAHALPR